MMNQNIKFTVGKKLINLMQSDDFQIFAWILLALFIMSPFPYLLILLIINLF